jgi:HK97 family phage prohead protease
MARVSFLHLQRNKRNEIVMSTKHMSCALRVKEISGDGVFAGYASMFGELDQQNEIVAPGAFARTLAAWRKKAQMPAMLWMHDPTQPIGLWLSLREDNSGLAVEGRLALRTQKGAEAYELLRLKALTGLSIGYRVVSSRVDAKRKARVLTDVDLFEISLVTFPANEAARVSVVKSPASDRRELRAAALRLRQAAEALTGRDRRL